MFALIDKETNAVVQYPGPRGMRIGDRLLVSPTVAGWEDDNYRVLPVDEIDPPFDRATQTKSDWVVTVEADRVVRERTVTDKTAEQIAQEADDAKEDKLDAIDVLQLHIDFNHENRIRVLEGKAEITPAQFRAALKARL